MFPRFFKFSKSQSFFLFGPRGCGKSTWLKQQFPQATWFDLLDEGLYHQLLREPALFQQQINSLSSGQWVVIDEVQRLPGLLNFVHQAIENKKLRFALTGSSARKLKRGQANLLAGRALQRRFEPLTAQELGSEFSFQRSLMYGHLPSVFSHSSPKDYLQSYVGTYLREEVQQEAFVRDLGRFAKALEFLSFSQAQVLSVQRLATDLGVDRKTAESYISIMEDLLIVHRVPVFQKRAKRQMTVHPKFFFFDVGVYRALRPKGPLDSTEELEGSAIETLVFQELKAHINNFQKNLDIYFYRTRTKHEVDFVLYGEDGFFAIEVKKGDRIRKSDLAGVELFKTDYPQAQVYVLYGGTTALKTDTNIQILPIQTTLPDLQNIFK